jgi:GntR family trehalose operon transcriptional repressor
MGKTIYDEIYRELRKRIISGDFAPQSFLPSEAKLTEEYGCSRMTVRKAISMLANEGMVAAIKGRGVRVICSPEEKNAAEKIFRVDGLTSFTESARSIGAAPSAQLFLLDHIVCTAAIAHETGFPEGRDLTRVNLVRSLNGQAMAIDRHLFLTEVVPGIDESIAVSSLFRYCEQDLGLEITVSNREVTVEKPTEEDIRLLGIEDPLYLAVVRSRTFDSAGDQFEHVESKYLPSWFHFFDSATRTPLP